MCDTCGDNRFELIEKYKQKLLDATNIGDSPEEMAVIDNILFRFWQMGWLEKLELFGISEQLDIISRSVAIEALNEYFSRIGKLKRLGLNNAENAIRLDTVGVIKTLPSVQQWIPCKTAFPEKENTRVTYQTNAGVIIFDGIYGGIDAYGHRVWLDRERGLYWDDEVVAWMPIVIPEPWKGEKP